MLKEASRTVTTESARRQAQRIFIIAEVALAVVLLFGAGLFVRSLLLLQSVPTGYDPHNLVTMAISLNRTKYSDSRVLVFCRQLLERCRTLAGVQTAAIANSLPMTGTSSINFVIEGRPRPLPGEEPASLARAVTTDYFRTMRIAFLKGRDFTDQDDDRSPRVAIINENLALQFFHGEDPVGRYLSILPPRYSEAIQPGKVEIIGVAGNVKEVGLDEVPFGDIYVPFLQNRVRSMFLVARAGSGTSGVVAAIRREVVSLDKDQPAYSIQSMEERLSDSLAGSRFNMFLTEIFAALALALACVGLYGVLSYSVAQRTHEVGIRMAFGASVPDVLKLIVREGAGLALAGIGIGSGVSIALGYALRNTLYLVPYVHNGVLYGVSPHDPVTLLIASITLLATALLASYAPARRATKVDPMVALRYE